MDVVNTILSFNREIIERFLLFLPAMILTIIVMYLAAFIIATINYKKNLISKKEFDSMLFINEITFFKNNYKSIIYIFLVNQIYKKRLI